MVRAVDRYLTESPATAKGHMKRRWQYTRSWLRPTRLSKQQWEQIREIFNRVEDNNESVGDRINHLFCYAALADKQENTVYMDLTGRFPYTPLNGNQCMLVVYDYTTNTILVEPIENFESKTICDAYAKAFK